MSRKIASLTLCLCLVTLFVINNAQTTGYLFAVGSVAASYVGGGWQASAIFAGVGISSEILVGTAGILLAVNPFLVLGVGVGYAL